MINIAKVTSFLFFLKLGCSCVLILHLSADSSFAPHKQTGQERPIFIKEGWIGEVTSSASNKTQILELVDSPSSMKLLNFDHMISHG